MINLSFNNLNIGSLFEVLIFSLSHDNDEIVVHSLWFISNLINENELIRNLILTSIVFDRLMLLMKRNLTNKLIMHLTKTMALLVKEKTNATSEKVIYF